MAAEDVITEVIRFLEAGQARGRQRVFLDPDTAHTFFSAEPRPPVAGVSAARTVPPAPVVASPAVPGRVVREKSPLPSAAPAADSVWTPPPAETGEANLQAHTLESLATAVAACRRCRLCQHRRQAVFADGDTHARLMFIGEGPGEDEDIQGKPFVGKAGQLLTKMIEAMQLQRDAVYIANIVKCRPPGNRVPQEDEATACLPFLQRQIELVKPAAMVVLGATPFLYLLGRKGISQLRGTWHEYRGIPVMPTFHPAYLLRVPERKREVWNDLQQVMVRLGIKR